MAQTHTIEVEIGSDALRATAFDEATVTLDMLQPGSPWTLTLWRGGRETAWDELRAAALLYASVAVKIDGALQLRGTIERIREGGDRSGAPFTIAGRDLAGIAMSSDADPAVSFRGVTLSEALTRLFQPLGLPIVVGLEAADARRVQAGAVRRQRASTARHGARASSTASRRHHVDITKPKPGDRIWQVADRLARRHGYLLYTAPTATGVGLVLDAPRYDAPVDYQLLRRRTATGEWAGNILSGFRDFDGAEVPTFVTVFGHSGVSTREDARHRSRVENEGLTRSRVAPVITARPRYVHDPRARTPQVAEQRARREIAKAMERFETYECTVQGFGQAGKLYAVNAMAHIEDGLAGMRRDCLITGVTFSRSRQSGTTTRLRLVPSGSIVIEPDAS